jgi:hypothetical protein
LASLPVLDNLDRHDIPGFGEKVLDVRLRRLGEGGWLRKLSCSCFLLLPFIGYPLPHPEN